MSSYWALVPIEEIAGKVKEKFDNYRKWLNHTGYANRIKTSYQRFYAMDRNGNLRIVRDEDDIARIDVNHFKSFIRRMHIIATENKLAYQPRARNSDSKSQNQADMGRGICDYYGDEKNMNGVLSSAVLATIIMLEQVIHCPWDQNEGQELAVDESQVITSGDQRFEVLSAFNAARNTSTDDSPWWILRIKVNKWDYAAMHPEFAEEIQNSVLERDEMDLDFNAQRNEGLFVDDEDYTFKYILYHKRTSSVPAGLWVEVCAGQVLRYGPLRYPRMPVVRMKAGNINETPFADSPAVDLIGIQEAINALFSGALTNGLNNALQLLYCQDPNLITRKLETGQILVTAAQPPVPLNLNGTNGPTIELIEMLNTHGQLISGINDVARGNPSSNLKSGASLAVVLAQAIQYIGEIQKSYARAAGEVGTILLANLREFGPEELIGYITGISRKGHVRMYKKADIMDIERVTVDLGNPLTQQFAGRYELAQSWAQLGVMKNPKQIEAFIRTGELDQVTEDNFSDEQLIRDENEQIKRGEVPPVLLLDNHAEHIIRHKAVFSTPEAREDPRIVQAGLKHIQEHLNIMPTVPPDLAAVITGQPMPLPAGAEGGIPGEEPMPTVDGARMPGTPPGMPPQAQENYDEALDALPQDLPMAN